MKQLRIARNIACVVLFAFCVIPLGIIYKIEEGFILSKRRKKKQILSDEETKPGKTFYPEGWDSECSTEDFNKWSEYIHRQLN